MNDIDKIIKQYLLCKIAYSDLYQYFMRFSLIQDIFFVEFLDVPEESIKFVRIQILNFKKDMISELGEEIVEEYAIACMFFDRDDLKEI